MRTTDRIPEATLAGGLSPQRENGIKARLLFLRGVDNQETPIYPKPDEPEPNVGRALPDMVGEAHPTDATLACFRFTLEAAPVFDLRYILVTNCDLISHNVQ